MKALANISLFILILLILPEDGFLGNHRYETCKDDDKEHWYQITAQPVAGYAGHIHWRVDDVTQKRMADRAIRDEREKLYKKLHDH